MASEDLPANGPDPSATKPELRRTFRAARAAYVAGLAPGERAALEAGLAAILAAHLPPGAIAAYHAVADEIDPAGLDRPQALPRVVRGQRLMFHAGPRAACHPGALGIPEPSPDAPRVEPDIVLVPLLGIDPTGTRLGYGGGYYDRTLGALRTARPVFAVGVAWDMQLVASLPVDPWDARLDALATPTRWLTFAARSPTSPE